MALGTSRVWYSEQWFRTFSDNAAGVWRVQAVTLPSFTDPRAGNANDAVTDVLEHGPVPPGTVDTWATGVRALRWACPDRLYVLMPGAVHRLDRTPPTGPGSGPGSCDARWPRAAPRPRPPPGR